ncbi:MAG: glycosyltransferase family 4 protein [Pseudomonadota bacterium]
MNVLIVDPGLRSMGGHHYSAVNRLRSELARLGAKVRCLGSAYADVGVIADLACTPTFSRSVYGRTYARRGEFRECVEETERELHAAWFRADEPPGLVVLPCCDQVLACALAQVLRRSWRHAPPRVLMWILYGPHHALSTTEPASVALLGEARTALLALAAAVGLDRMRVYCETSLLADFYQASTGLDVAIMPGPGLRLAPRPLSLETRMPVVCSIGFANRAKGYRLLPEAIAHVMARHDTSRFAIHGVVRGSDAESDGAAFAALSGMGERVVVNQDVLTADEYAAWLSAADLLLMPYDPCAYRSRGSGVLADARAMGIPIVATRGCAFAQPAFDEGWGQPIDEYSGRGIGHATLAAIERLPELRGRAANAAGSAADDLGQVLRRAVDGGSQEAPPRRGASVLRRLGARLA